MKFFSIVTTGRTGSDYLNACLDDLDEVMTFCGTIDYAKYFSGPGDKIEKKELIDVVLKEYHYLFSHHKKENIQLNIDTIRLREIFLNLNSNLKLNRKEFLVDLFKSYHLILNRKVEDAKVLVFNTHNIALTKKFLEDFPESKILITIRDPRANLKSGIINWQDYDSSLISIEHSYYYLKRIREDLKFLLTKVKNDKLFIKLEEANDYKTKKKIVDFLEIKYDEKIYVATIGSKIWIGDALSKVKASKGEFIKSVVDNGWKFFFSNKDILLLNEIYNDYKKFGYEISPLGWPHKIVLFFYIFLPMTFEKKTFEAIKNKNLSHKIANYFSFIKRIIYFLLILFKLDMFVRNKRYNQL